MIAVSGYKGLTVKLEALYRLSGEYHNGQTAIRVMRDMILRGKI